MTASPSAHAAKLNVLLVAIFHVLPVSLDVLRLFIIDPGKAVLGAFQGAQYFIQLGMYRLRIAVLRSLDD